MTGVSTSCGACKFLRRRCTNECVFAPYFSYDEAPVHFSAVHKVFGASNVSRLLLRLPEQHRSEAAISVAYEALARIRDPVYGCVAYIYALQQEVAILQEEIEMVGNHINTVNLNTITAVPTDNNNCGSCQASNNNNYIINNNNNIISSSSQLSTNSQGGSPMNVLEYSTGYHQQERVVPTHQTDINVGAYGGNCGSMQDIMLPYDQTQPMPLCEWEGLLDQDIFNAQQWLVN